MVAPDRRVDENGRPYWVWDVTNEPDFNLLYGDLPDVTDPAQDGEQLRITLLAAHRLGTMATRLARIAEERAGNMGELPLVVTECALASTGLEDVVISDEQGADVIAGIVESVEVSVRALQLARQRWPDARSELKGARRP